MAYGKITEKQSQILEYIKSEILNKGYPPSVRDICQAVNLKSTSSVHSHLETLEKNGYIRRDPTKPRTIEIIDDNFNLVRREVVNVPMVGTVAAGQPILAIENIDNYFPIPSEYMPNEETFMLKVKGESMINAGILDGDNILVKRQNTAKNGDMVVVERFKSHLNNKYKCKCSICGHETVKIERKMKKGVGCGVCSGAIFKKGINDIATTAPWMVEWLKNKEDAYNYQRTTNKIEAIIIEKNTLSAALKSEMKFKNILSTPYINTLLFYIIKY